MTEADPLYHSASYLKSAYYLKDLPPDGVAEVAFAGRSNAGKSSAINTLVGQTRLAHTSKTPGRTQLINFYLLNNGAHLVDLPGYGFAKVRSKLVDHWRETLGAFLAERESLSLLALIMDARHPLTDYDKQMLEWCHHNEIAVHCVLTKSDKLKRGPAKNTLFAVQKDIKKMGFEATVQLFSSLKKDGLEELSQRLDEHLKK